MANKHFLLFYFAAAGKIGHQRAEKTQIPNGKQNFAQNVRKNT